MASFPVVEYPYLGSLLAVNLFSADTTILLSFFGTSQSTTLVDDGTRLYVGEDVSMGGQTYEFAGSGTAQPGINLLGLTVPTGFPVDMLLLRNTVTGKLHFVFPAGVPNATGMIAMVISLDPVGYDLNAKGPLCFAEGTLIRTIEGDVPVERLTPGTRLVSPGRPHVTLLACLKATPQGNFPAASLPVIIRAGAFGQGRPQRDLWLTQQHRLGVGGPQLNLLFGLDGAIAPALGLVDFDRVTIGYGEKPTYYHLLCDRHALCLAEGIAAETLAWGGRVEDWIGAELYEALKARHTQLHQPYAHCLPSLTVAETRLLARSAGLSVAGLQHDAFAGYPTAAAANG